MCYCKDHGCHRSSNLRIIAKQGGMEDGGDLEKAPLLIHGKASGCQLTVQLLYSTPAHTIKPVSQHMQLETLGPVSQRIQLGTTACC